ncbi:MAG TPA: DUF5686 family protein [Ferruginibacter sp.]|nr:DUF5686 family protein [Ferruginibacter sp.]HMP21789.1 DUF5686 family protein [Ferruginibacter sp.]
MSFGKRIKVGVSVFILLLLVSTSQAQQTIVKGFVRDAITKRPMSLVSVVFKNSKGVSTGDDGSYSIQTIDPKKTILVFSYVGYKTVSIEIVPNEEQLVNVEMELTAAMKEVVVKRGRGKYRNKNNPAVELIDKVIENRENNRIKSYNYVQYQQYEKLGLSLTNKPEKLANNRLLRRYKFIVENVDTTLIEGKTLLPIYIEEKLSERYLRKNPESNKTRILSEKKVNFGDFLDSKGISSYLNRLYADIDIYENNINILATQFLSPIANMGPTFYRYYIRDTTEMDGVKLIRLYFTPRNPNDLLFRGVMFVTLDGNYGVQKIEMTISKKANINWTKELRIRQDFQRGNDGKYTMIKSDMMAEFAIANNASGGIFGERVVSYKNLVFDTPAPDSIYKAKDIVDLSEGKTDSDSFWISSRHVPLSTAEAKTYYNIDSLRNLKSFKTFATVFTALFSGYVVLNKYEIGNTNTFYSFNPVEGFRLRVGGRSTMKLSNRFYFENYLAYGFKDQQFKYLLSGTYSFNGKSIYAYPLNYIKASYQKDMRIPGQELQFVQEDNFLLSFKRGNNDKWVYNNIYKIEYIREFGKNVAYTFGFKNTRQTPAGAIEYRKQEGGNGPEVIPNITTTELSAEIRWAPNEQFYQGKNFRIPIINKYPIMRFRYIAGIKDAFKGQYNYHNFNAYFEKRCYMSQLGYTDITLEGGYIFGQVPFPLLITHRANQTYSFQLNSYNLMNFMEFVSDKYASANFDLHFNGFFFNKVPLLKKLKLREVASAKLLYGSVRDENNPAKSDKVFEFLKDQNGVPTTYTLNNGPYIEASVGIGNIFKLFRVDVVKRLTYLNNPTVQTWGIRTRAKFDF